MKNKRYIGVILIAMGMCYSVGAATGIKISATLKNQGMFVNGKQVNQEVIMYKDTTYLPLRQVGEMMGTNVDYKNGKVILGDIDDETLRAIEAGAKKEETIHYKKYSNPRFGFSISYPDFLTKKIVPENGDGITLFNTDKTTKLLAWGSNNVIEDTVMSSYEGAIATTSNLIYETQKDNWYVLSWQEGSSIHYRKCIVNPDTIYAFEIQYPATDEEKYNEIVETLCDTFTVSQ